MKNKFDEYEMLCKDIKFQMGYIDDIYQMDFDYLQDKLNMMKILQAEVLMIKIKECKCSTFEYSDNKRRRWCSECGKEDLDFILSEEY